MLENVDEWFPQDFHNQEVIEVSNGYAPRLSITLQKFNPIDASLLEHILWRELRKTDFARIPSSPYGIIEEIPSQRLEVYFDEHISHLVMEIQRNVGTTVSSQIYAQTLFCAHKYTMDNQETVRVNSSPAGGSLHIHMDNNTDIEIFAGISYSKSVTYLGRSNRLLQGPFQNLWTEYCWHGKDQ